ncbi:AAA family ATPase [Pseudarthrobacter sp. P1]|uniref:AAA family ATPase n=1 Tax=Pseudarthrobacter sp. P1 TaxID=3418418 RepID=UPI003CE88CCA
MSSIPVVAVGAGAAELVDGLERLHGPVTVVRRCAELSDLLAACQSGLARAAVVAAGTTGLTATLVDRLAAVGVAVLALAEDPAEVARLQGIGAEVAAPSIAADALAARICAVAGAGVRASAGGFSLAGSAAGWTARPAVRLAADGVAAAQPGLGAGNPGRGGPGDGSRVLAVWGPTGAPGRTTIAVNLAAELAAEGKSVVLVDADSYGASVAAVLGLLDESASLAHACRLADAGSLGAAALAKVAAPVVFGGGTMRVLTGLTRAERWPELRAAAMERVLARCREVAEVAVVDCGFSLENDEELSYDTVAPRRNAATLAVLAAADTVYAVGAADAVGMPRLIRGLGELSDANPAAEISVLLNKVRRSAAGRGAERALAQAWERFGPQLQVSHFLPWDAESTDKALLAGRLLMEVAPESALRKSIRAIVCAPVQRGRKSAVAKTTAGPGNKG